MKRKDKVELRKAEGAVQGRRKENIKHGKL